MQHAGLQYGQGAANSHQSPPFAHNEISQSNGGNTTSSLRQFRKKDGIDKNSSTDLNTIENSHIARVAPHNHYPARPNDYFRYHHQYPDYNSPYKETPAPVKYSEIAETPPQPLQHVDHIPSTLQKHKEPHKDFMDMCNITQPAHMKQNYPENLTRQQSYPPDASVHHQYLHKEPQVHPNYKPESQYQQYPPQLAKYNMPSQCRKYPPPPENDFLAKLQRINPSMARSIMSDHHIRESQSGYPAMDQARMYQNQRYYPNHMQNNPSYNYHGIPQPYNYPSSCNYKHPEYGRPNQMPVGGTQYPALNSHPDRLSPRNMTMGMNYGTPPQKVSPNYGQYNQPEYAQHYQHRRTSMQQEYYQQACRNPSYMGGHQISPETSDSRASSGGLRHYIENWAEEEAPGEIAPIFKESVRIHNDGSNEHVFVINSSDIPQLENVALVPTENGQFIIKSGLDNSVVRIEKTNENVADRTVNLQIVDTAPKPDCMVDESQKTAEENLVPYKENQTKKDCDEEPRTIQPTEEPNVQSEEKSEVSGADAEASVIVCNEVSVIKDMPLIDDEQRKISTPAIEAETSKVPQTESEEPAVEDLVQEDKIATPIDPDISTLEKELLLDEKPVISSTKRTQRIFSVDDIMNKIGAGVASPPTSTRRNSLQLTQFHDVDDKDNPPEEEKEPEKTEVEEEKTEETNEPVNEEEEVEYANAISVENDSIILEIGGALVQLNINHLNGTKVLSVLPLSESLVIDVNGNLQECEPANLVEQDKSEEEEIQPLADTCEDKAPEEQPEIAPESEPPQPETAIPETENEKDINHEALEDEISSSVFHSEVVIGEESMDAEVFLDVKLDETVQEELPPEPVEPIKIPEPLEFAEIIEPIKPVEPDVKIEEPVTELRESVETPVEPLKLPDAKKLKEPEPIKKKEKRLSSDEKKKSKHHDDEKRRSSSKKSTKPDEKKSGDKSKRPPKLNGDVLKVDRKKLPEKKPEKKHEIKNEELKKKEEKKCEINSEEPKKKEEKKCEIKSEEPIKKEEKKIEIKNEDPIGEVLVKPPEFKEKKNVEEKEKPLLVSTKAAKKQYESDSTTPIFKETKVKTEERVKLKVDVKRSMSKLEETVNKIKSLKEKSEANGSKALIINEIVQDLPKKEVVKDLPDKKLVKCVKRVTFNLDTEVKEISSEEMDRKKLSWEEYNYRKRRIPPMGDSGDFKKNRIMEDTVTSTRDINDEVVEEVELSIEKAIEDSTLKKTPPRIVASNWEDDPESPVMPDRTSSSKPTKCIIDINEFNIKPIERVSTPSPVSSSQFSYHSEDDSLQVYKNVVDSKLNSLNITIPKVTNKPKPVDKFSVLFDRFLNKGSLNCSELEKVKKIIELKRKMIEEKQYEVRNERDYKDLKLHLKKVPEKRKHKRFRNLYTDDTSEESDSSRSEKGVADYSVYQRNSQQGVPKLIFKRKSGLPQPFVKLERSQAVELLAKKRKLY